MSEPTPRPWRAKDGDVQLNSYNVTIAHCVTAGLPADANAALIVRAVNSHDELVAALRGLLPLEAFCDDRKDGHLFAAAHAALVKARPDDAAKVWSGR